MSKVQFKVIINIKEEVNSIKQGPRLYHKLQADTQTMCQMSLEIISNPHQAHQALINQ